MQSYACVKTKLLEVFDFFVYLFASKNYQNSILIVWTTILWISYFVLWACFSLLLREPRRLSSSLRLSKCISKKKLIINVNCNDRYSPLIHHIKETCPVHKRSPFSSSYWRDSIKVSPPPIPCWQSLLRSPDILDILFCFLLINVSWVDKAQKTTKRGGSDFLDVFFHYLPTHYKILN